jgi:cyanophycin synthetase
VKAVVPSVVRSDGYAVLNGDDPLVAAMRRKTAGQVAFFSLMPPGTNPLVESHLAAGGLVARVEGTDHSEVLVIQRGAERLLLGRVAEVPLTFGGHARFQIGNLLAAALAAFTQDVPLDAIRHGLMTFAPSASRTPGRLNVIETVRGRVMIDYAHNAAAIAGLLDFVRRLPAGRRMALLGVPGDRRDEDLREVGRLCAGLDLAVFKEHAHYRRGRPPGEAARIMAEGARAAGMPADRVRSFDDEAAAVAATLEVMQAGDVVAIIADDAAAVREQLRPYLTADQSQD